MAARIRTRFGSDAKNAVLTRGEWPIEYAVLRHSSTLAPSSTVMVMNLVAPSPSRTIICASTCARSVTAADSCAYSVVLMSEISAWPAPVAINMKESLVDVSPSIVMQLNDWSAACFTKCSSTGCATLASVAMNPSIVAMFGLIMPAPLLFPVKVTALPLMLTTRVAALGCVAGGGGGAAAGGRGAGRGGAGAGGTPD